VSKKKKEIRQKTDTMVFTLKNWIFFGIGLLSIIVGYVTLAKGSITLAPILLVLGYAVFIPIGIILKK